MRWLADDGEVASSTVNPDHDGEYKFFDIPFFAGVLVGLVIGMLFFIIFRGRKNG